MKEKKVKVLISLPESIKAWLDRTSTVNDRTASGEITRLLRRTMEQEMQDEQKQRA
ncbi:hypothetical protein PF66_06189 [Pseudomonas asplenii]|uniref:Arc-like DNA binding domain-containing protein n=1 Tax=Pseudomonas asplenii TaxID=53407 RepID=A0A0M9GBU6_9PSED|nr:hypothetical protein [Pseudomonas fuscovaginae]KPA87279.1 hypothetical protein PF66_06189 [Pseudomonas fuscovaginae]